METPDSQSSAGKRGDETPEISVPESRVLIIMTGGTICMRRSELGFIPARGFLQTCMHPHPSFNDGSSPDPIPVHAVPDALSSTESRSSVVPSTPSTLLPSLRTPISSHGRTIRYTVSEFPTLLDSSSISAAGWNLIGRTIAANYTLFDAFVVLHGTDSLAYTCSALSFMLENLGKPVIFTGSQVPMLELQNDAVHNLLGSLVMAGHFMIPEVCLFFNHTLYRGNRCTKTSANDFAAFASPNHAPLATMSSLKTHVNWGLIHRPRTIDRFHVQTDLDTAHVACLRLFPGIRAEMVDGVLRLPGLRGLVLETFGAGNAPGGEDGELTRVIEGAVGRGVVIVNVTQCTTGTVSAVYAPATILGKAGVVMGWDMTTEAALTKLSYLLSNPDLGPIEVARRMGMSIRGELTGEEKVNFRHPRELETEIGGVTPGRTAALAALGSAISRGDLQAVQEVMRTEPEWLLNEADSFGSTPLHLAAIGPNLEIIRLFLSHGASVHLRNRAGRTPLFLAASAGKKENVVLLRHSGAHLHPPEISRAWLKSVQNAGVWKEAGLTTPGEKPDPVDKRPGPSGPTIAVTDDLNPQPK